MKVASVFAPLALIFASLSNAITVSFDETYDDAGGSLTSVACSDGVNGLITRTGAQNFGQLRNFPFIGGAAAVAGFNSPQCGSCDAGFNIALTAMNALTNNQAVQLGRIDAGVRQVDSSVCGGCYQKALKSNLWMYDIML